MENYGIERSKVIAVVEGLEVRSCKGLSNVVPNYGGGNSGCYINGGANQMAYGFYQNNPLDDGCGYWFRRKSDALYAAKYVMASGWHGAGDLEHEVQNAMINEFIANGRKGKLVELGKCYF